MALVAGPARGSRGLGERGPLLTPRRRSRRLLSYCCRSSMARSAGADRRDARRASDPLPGGKQNHNSSPMLSGTKTNTLTSGDTF